jgi:hypothetical protein
MEAAVVIVLTFVLLAAVVAFVGAPLRRARTGNDHAGEPAGAEAARARARRETLEAAREAKYREIRDAELDYRTGKLSREDYEAIDATLRAEAIEILDRLDPPPPGEPAGAV